MASNNFRDSLNSLGWSRRDEPVNTSANTPILGRLQSLNPFGQGGYVRLPVTETNPGAPLPAPSRREEEEGFFARTYTSIQLFIDCWAIPKSQTRRANLMAATTRCTCSISAQLRCSLSHEFLHPTFRHASALRTASGSQLYHISYIY